MMTTTIDNVSAEKTTGSVSAEKMCAFLSRYATVLFAAGATCIRIEKNVTRIAQKYGYKATLMIFPRKIFVSVSQAGAPVPGDAVLMADVPPRPVSYKLNTRLSSLSWAVADGKIDIDKAQTEMQNAIDADRGYPLPEALLTAVANGCFCGLFGGDRPAMAVAAIAAAAGCYLKALLMARKIDIRVIWLVCAFVSGVSGCSAMLFGWGNTPAVALGTSVLYLVPGIALLNSFSDLLYRHYLCAVSRFADAAMLTACLSAGLYTAIILMSASVD